MIIGDRDDENRKSYANEMDEEDHKMYLQVLAEKKATLNMFKVNLAFLLLIIAIVLYFLTGPNYILTWFNVSKFQPTDFEIEIGLNSFTITTKTSTTTSYSCFDYSNQCRIKSSSPSCLDSGILTPEQTLRVDCTGLYHVYTIGIIFTSLLVIGLAINVISIISIVLVFLDKGKAAEKGIFVSKFEFVFYFIASGEYCFHLLIIEGNFRYRFYVMIIYGCVLMSFLNILFIRRAFYKYLVLMTRLELTRISKMDLPSLGF